MDAVGKAVSWKSRRDSVNRQPMNSDEHDAHFIFRSVGSIGLVIFERDGTLLKRNCPPADFVLGDISDQFVDMLKQLRQHSVRFGFISDNRGMDTGSHGRAEFVMLTRLLDDLLNSRGSMPDFWMAWNGHRQRSGSEFLYRYDQRQSPVGNMILRAIEWYGVKKTRTLFVDASAAGLLVGNDMGLKGLRYLGLRSNRTIQSRIASKLQYAPTSEATEIRSLCARIQQILALSDWRQAETPICDSEG